MQCLAAPETNKWTKLSPQGTLPSPRFGNVAVIHGDSFVVYAGYDGHTWLNDMHEYNFCALQRLCACVQARIRSPVRGPQ